MPVSLPLPVISLDGLLVACYVGYPLYVPPMGMCIAYGKYRESNERTKKFLRWWKPSFIRSVQCRTRALFMRSNPLIWPGLRPSYVAKKLLSVFSLEAQNFYFVRPNMFL